MTFTSQVINLASGHIAGMPIEETVGSLGPALLLVVGAALATLRARLRRLRRDGGEGESRAILSDEVCEGDDLSS
jgi:hypothetical protein